MSTSARRESPSGDCRTVLLASVAMLQPAGAVNVAPPAVVRGAAAASRSAAAAGASDVAGGCATAAVARTRRRGSPSSVRQGIAFLDPSTNRTPVGALSCGPLRQLPRGLLLRHDPKISLFVRVR